jgi:hypothetical protein
MEEGVSPPVFTAIDHTISDLPEWMFNTIRPYLRGRILLVDDGHNLLPPLLLGQEIPFHLAIASKLTQVTQDVTSKGNSILRAVHSIDFYDPDFVGHNSAMFEVFDVVIHSLFENLQRAIRLALDNTEMILRTRGYLIMVVPSTTAFYEDIDLSQEELMHLERRQLEDRLNPFRLVKANHFQIQGDRIPGLQNQSKFQILTVAKRRKII